MRPVEMCPRHVRRWAGWKPTQEKKSLLKANSDSVILHSSFQFETSNEIFFGCEILVKFAYSWKSFELSSYHCFERVDITGISIFSSKKFGRGILFIFYKQETSISQYTLKRKKYMKKKIITIKISDCNWTRIHNHLVVNEYSTI